jgi:hypothetical protein
VQGVDGGDDTVLHLEVALVDPPQSTDTPVCSRCCLSDSRPRALVGHQSAQPLGVRLVLLLHSVQELVKTSLVLHEVRVIHGARWSHRQECFYVLLVPQGYVVELVGRGRRWRCTLASPIVL